MTDKDLKEIQERAENKNLLSGCLYRRLGEAEEDRIALLSHIAEVTAQRDRAIIDMRPNCQVCGYKGTHLCPKDEKLPAHGGCGYFVWRGMEDQK